MASLIPGYEYDIFISYRQKDNKYDGWVTEFVDSLKKELEATFKEEISLYFDANPNDGLLGTHDVDASLKEKLKSLIFMPIISRTYCDPKSYAWEHEFMDFIEQASNDRFGLKVKLTNGNVATRVLPVKIYDLDADDINLFEKALGGVIRGIDFIYKSPGVNRPLRSKEENPNENLNHTIYRDQINKVGNAIKDIIIGLQVFNHDRIVKDESAYSVADNIRLKRINVTPVSNSLNSKRIKYLSGAFLTVFIISSILFVYPNILGKRLFHKPVYTDKRLSVAVFPFQNVSNDTSLIVLGNILQDNIVNVLSNFSDNLIVRQPETINTLLQRKGITNYASLTPSLESSLSKILDAEISVSGAVVKIGNTVIISAKLIDTKKGEVFKSFEVQHLQGKVDVIKSVDSISNEIKNYLILSKLKKERNISLNTKLLTQSAEAYRYYLNGVDRFQKRDFISASGQYARAFKIDSNFYSAGLNLVQSNYNDYLIRRKPELLDSARATCLRLYRRKDKMNDFARIQSDLLYARLFQTPQDVLKYNKQLIALDEKSPGNYYNLGYAYVNVRNYDEAITAFEKSLEIYKEWGVKPSWANDYYFLALCYNYKRLFEKEKKLLIQAEKDFPDNERFYLPHFQVSVFDKDTLSAKKYISKYIQSQRSRSVPEKQIARDLAMHYFNVGWVDEAEIIFREELSKYPDDVFLISSLGYLLIDNRRDVNTGLELIEKALKKNPSEPNILDSKGWGLYRQGKLDEALIVLETAVKLYNPYQTWAIDAVNAHIDSVKKAIAEQRKN